jgi:hypothetical protein
MAPIIIGTNGTKISIGGRSLLGGLFLAPIASFPVLTKCILALIKRVRARSKAVMRVMRVMRVRQRINSIHVMPIHIFHIPKRVGGKRKHIMSMCKHVVTILRSQSRMRKSIPSAPKHVANMCKCVIRIPQHVPRVTRVLQRLVCRFHIPKRMRMQRIAVPKRIVAKRIEGVVPSPCVSVALCCRWAACLSLCRRQEACLCLCLCLSLSLSLCLSLCRRQPALHTNALRLFGTGTHVPGMRLRRHHEWARSMGRKGMLGRKIIKQVPESPGFVPRLVQHAWP